MKFLTYFGLSVISLIVVAHLTTPSMLVLSWSTIPMVVSIVLLAVVVQVKKFHALRSCALLACMALAAWVFVFDVRYLYVAQAFPMGFWHQVSAYTLPSILFESVIITLCGDIIAKSPDTRLRRQAVILVTIYAFVIMAVNFLALAGIVPVSAHIAISRIVLASIACLFFGYWFLRSTTL